MAEMPENTCGKYHTKSGDAKQAERTITYRRIILPQRASAHSSGCELDSVKTLMSSGATPATQQVKIPRETVPRYSPNAILVCNSYRVSSPLLSHIPTLQPAMPDSFSMMMQAQDKPLDFSQLLVH